MFKRFLVVILTLSLLVSSISFFNVTAVSTNLAAGKNVTSNATSYAEGNGESRAFIVTNGRNGSRTLAKWGYEANLWFEIDLGSAQTVNKVIVVFDTLQQVTVKDMAVDVKLSDGSYKRVAEVHLTEQPGTGAEITFTFESVETSAVRFTGNKANSNNKHYFSLCEIEVFNDASVTAPYTGVNKATDPTTVIPKYFSGENYALTATSSLNFCRHEQEKVANVNDGRKDSRCIPYFVGESTSKVINYELKLKELTDINTVNIITDPTDGAGVIFAKSIAVDVQDADGYWVRVAEYHGITVAYKATQISVNFETIKASAVRVSAHSKAMSNYSEGKDQQNLFFSLAEIEIYNSPVVTEEDYSTVTSSQTYTIPEYFPKRPVDDGENNDDNTNNKARVILLCGQSNATGQSLVSYLEQTSTEAELAEYKAGYDNILIKFMVDGYANKSSDFVPVSLGQGATTAKFGPEVGIASYLTKAFPGEKFYIIKVSWSGSGIAQHWQEGTNEYTHIKSSIDSAFANLEQQNLEPELFAFCWMQGETDALNSTYANNYYNLQSELFTRLFSRYERFISPKGLSVIDAGISQFWKYNELVNEAKKKYASEKPNRYFIDTQSEGLSYELENNDPSHYDSQAMIKLGKLFGEYIETVLTKEPSNIKGDLTGDYSVDQTDYQYIADVYTGKIKVDNKAEVCDINGDGKFDIRDIIAINELI